MREIKFRAWDAKSDKWLLGYGYKSLSGFSLFGECVFLGEWQNVLHDHQHEKIDLRVMQYTGLKDKYGKEIYEDDIVRILYTDWPSQSENNTQSFEEYQNSMAHIGKIVFNPFHGWRIEDIGSVNYGTYGWIEVIGNIYENPELLKGQES